MCKILTTVLVLLVIIGSPATSVAKSPEPIQMGAYIGTIPNNIDLSRRNGYPIHYGTWAGNLYLYKNKLEIQEWVNTNKGNMIKKALNSAKVYAKSEGYKYFAIDNITFQIIHTDNQAELFFDCNIIAWK